MAKKPKPGGVYINGKRVTAEQWAAGELLKALTPPGHDFNAAPAPEAAPEAAPAAPEAVNPFLTGDDLEAINQFYTDFKTKLEDIDFNLTNLETDTTFQKSNIQKDAKNADAAATDDAIARGIFRSSVKDANIYDIEASRSLSTKFLDDKLTTARLNAGTNKKILADAKVEFDKRYGTKDGNGNPIWGTKAFENAQGVNDGNNSAWATAMAAWKDNPANTPAPAGPTFKPAAPQKGLAPAANKPASLFAPTPKPASKPKPGAKPKTQTTKVVYGNTP